jgi:serine O-acetyltransferase
MAAGLNVDISCHGDSIIGKNCNISQNVTIGVSNHGLGKGTPILGDNVFVGPGAVIIGSMRIGNNVTVGANTVVNFDVPDFSTVITSGSVIVPKDLSPFYIHNPIK